MLNGESLLEHIVKNKQIIKYIFSIFLFSSIIITIMLSCLWFNCSIHNVFNIHFSLSHLLLALLLTLYLTYRTAIEIRYHTDLEELARDFNSKDVTERFEIAILIISKISFNLPQFKKHINEEK